MGSTTVTAVTGQSAALGQNEARRGVSALSSARASRSGIWVGIFAITMSFAAFTSALFVREGTADWVHLRLPTILYWNTLVLLASSATFAMSRRCLGSNAPKNAGAGRKIGAAWLVATLALGIAFCVGQYFAWQQLRAEGLYLATNPNSSFFYVLTFIHVLHVVAGLFALSYVVGRLMLGTRNLRKSFFDNTAIYWHFMGVLWVYLLLLCRVKL